MGRITDQGVERGLADIPNVSHMEEIAAALQRVEAGDDLPSAEDAEMFFSRAYYITLARYLSIYLILSTICRSIYLSIYLCIYLSIYLSI